MNIFHRRMFMFPLAALVFGLLGIVASTAEAVTTTLEIPDSTVKVGQTVSVPILLRDAPTGVSGFNVIVVNLNGSVASIDKVEMPDLGLTRIDIVSGSEVHIVGVDLNRLIESGSTDVNLATLHIQGLKRGTTKVSAQAVRLDDDMGNPIETQLVSGTLTVTKVKGSRGGPGGDKGKGKGRKK